MQDVNAIQDNLNPLMWTAKVRSLMGEEIDEGLSAFTLLFNDDYPNDPPRTRSLSLSPFPHSCSPPVI
jgi:hypothetical protein